MGGLHPVVAIYATFLNRAFDQVLMDVALHRCGVTFVLDRAGVTGDDGASHNGMWDMSILQVVPGLRLAAPRDGARLRELLREAVEVDDAPTVRALPQGPAAAPTSRRSTRPAAATCWSAAAPRTCWSSASARWPPIGGRGRRAAGRPGHRRHRRRPALGQAGRPGAASTSPASTGWWSASRTTACVGGCGAVLLQTLNDARIDTAIRNV